MPVDTSIYGNFKTPDPFGQLNSMIGLQKGMTENKLLQLQLLGKIVGGKALTDALDENGQLDIAKLTANLKSNPAGYAATAETLPGAVTVQGGQIGNTNAGVNLATNSFKNAGAAFGSLLAKTTGPLTRQAVVDEVLQGITTGRIDPKTGSAIIRGVPSDDKEVRAYAAGGWVSSLPPELATAATPGTPTKTGAPTTQTGAQFITQAVGGETAPPNGGQQSSGTAPATPAPGVVPVAPGAQPAATAPRPAAAAPPASSPAPGATPGAGKGVVTGLSPAASSALTATGTFSAGQGNALIAQADQYPTRMAALTNMEVDLDKAFLGPGSTEFTKFFAGMNQTFHTSFAAENVAATERIAKLANQIALQQATMLGTTDLGLTTAMGANPNAEYSKLGNHYIISMLKGNEDAIKTKARAWQDYQNSGGTPDTYGKWSSDFNKAFDPRVFQSVYMNDDDRAAMVQNMSKDELKTFRERYNTAVDSGWLPDPRKGGK